MANQNVTVDPVQVAVTGAADAAGNAQAAYTPQTAFSVYTLMPTVYVDSSWAGTPSAKTPTGQEGPATHFGVDAFATIQGGVNAVDVGGTVYVAAGQHENVLVNKSVTIRGAGTDAGGTVVQPSTAGFTITADNVTLQDVLVRGRYRPPR